MAKQIGYIVLFLIINFGGLAFGNFLMDNGPQSIWYQNLNKAPWTPPGWVFGVAWTTIMICFSFYLGKQFLVDKNIRSNTILFIIAFLLNVSWNFFFFNQHQVLLGFLVLIALTSIIFYYFFSAIKSLRKYRFLLLPYAIWLCIATSLNLYVLIHN